MQQRGCENGILCYTIPVPHGRGYRYLRWRMSQAIDRINKPASQSEPTISIPISGMTCASCVRRVEKALAKVEGVASANVNLATERADVTYDRARVSFGALKSAVERAGYGIREETVELPISG